MSVRTKLLFIIVSLSLPGLLNPLILWGLRRSVGTSVQITQTAGVRRQLTVSEMLSHLSDAEAALFSYQVGGDPDSVNQFRASLAAVSDNVAAFAKRSDSAENEVWAAQLEFSRRQAFLTGSSLISLRKAQARGLADLDERFGALLGRVSALRLARRADSNVYQTLLDSVQASAGEMHRALAAHLTSGSAVERVRFSTARFSLKLSLEKLARLDLRPGEAGDVGELAFQFGRIRQRAESLIAEREIQESTLGEFRNLMGSVGNLINDEILPHEATSFQRVQSDYDQAILSAVMMSFLLSAATILVALSVVAPVLRRGAASFQALLDGANRMIEGDLTQPVSTETNDELAYLGRAFNRMMEALTVREERLRELSKKLVIVQEEERRLVGLDLHDGLTQILLSANMHFSILSLRGEQLCVSSRKELALGRQRLEEAIYEVSWVTSELRPPELENLNLTDGLRNYVSRVAKRHDWELTFLTDGLTERDDTDPSVETAAFRIVQEALSNAGKYVAASRIEVSLKVVSASLHIAVTDWGRGFDVRKVSEKSFDSLGLLGMRERAELLGGRFDIDSCVGGGTKVRAAIPVRQAESGRRRLGS